MRQGSLSLSLSLSRSSFGGPPTTTEKACKGYPRILYFLKAGLLHFLLEVDALRTKKKKRLGFLCFSLKRSFPLSFFPFVSLCFSPLPLSFLRVVLKKKLLLRRADVVGLLCLVWVLAVFGPWLPPGLWVSLLLSSFSLLLFVWFSAVRGQTPHFEREVKEKEGIGKRSCLPPDSGERSGRGFVGFLVRQTRP
jgi:hypothetical protein